MRRPAADTRAKIAQSEAKEEFARAKAIKGLFGPLPGKEGTITIGEQKGAAILHVQPANAAAVMDLLAEPCNTVRSFPAEKELVVLTEAQQKSIEDAATSDETLAKVSEELPQRFRATGLRPSDGFWSLTFDAASTVFLVGAAVQFSKLVRSDQTVPDLNRRY